MTETKTEESSDQLSMEQAPSSRLSLTLPDLKNLSLKPILSRFIKRKKNQCIINALLNEKKGSYDS